MDDFDNLPISLTKIFVNISEITSFIKRLPALCVIDTFDTTQLPSIFKSSNNYIQNGNLKPNDEKFVGNSFNENMINAECDIEK
jgi:hypothetical protein